MRKTKAISAKSSRIKEEYILAVKSSQLDSKLFIRKFDILKLDISNVVTIHDEILFILNHAVDNEILQWAGLHLNKIYLWCKKNAAKYQDELDNSGLPFTHIYSLFSYTISTWLISNHYPASLNSYEEDKNSLNDVFVHTFPSYKRELTQLGLSNKELLSHLGVKEKDQLLFLLSQFSKLKKLH